MAGNSATGDRGYVPRMTDDVSERDLGELDDVDDRAELRRRSEMLLHELRVVLPGVQILLAFLLTVPFSSRFGELDQLGKVLFGITLTTASLSVVALLTPTYLHRIGARRARVERLRWSIRMMVAGLILLIVALLSGVWAVARFVFASTATWLIVGPTVVAAALAWIGLPLYLRVRRRRSD
jgi:small-conductance mechanosensitive channel